MKKFVLAFSVAVTGLMIVFLRADRSNVSSREASVGGETNVSDEAPAVDALVVEQASIDSGDAVASDDSMEQWRAYQAGKISFEQLSKDNQARVNRSKYLQWEQEDKARRERIQAMDVTMGINADVREREANLRRRAEKLYSGMGQIEVTALLGNPVKLLSSTNYSPSQRMRAGNHVMVFSPHPSGRISYRMGDSFQYLEVWLSTNNTLAGYRWRSPGS